MFEEIAEFCTRAFMDGDTRSSGFGATVAAIGYAEIHYRFRYFFSLLKRRRPEILADLPPRIETGGPFPLVITVKDADRYPARIDAVEIEIRKCADGKSIIHSPEVEPIELRESFRELFFPLPPAEKPGELDVTATIKGIYPDSGKRFSLVNDNYPGGFRQPFRVTAMEEPLPVGGGWFCGDIHCHSRYTDDQVEFGAGLESLSLVAAATGYSWAGVTDHSYDMDDLPGDYLKNDPSLEKWGRFHEEILDLNKLAGDGGEEERRTRAHLVPGEEVSCGGSGGWNLHLILLGNRKFIPGYGDGAEKWLRTKPTSTLDEVLDQVEGFEEPVACYAAHPFAKINFLERLLVNRGPWEPSDLAKGRLHGWQLWNRREVDDPDVLRGLRPWVNMLLHGKRIALAAGSDSHGNFGAERSIRVPFLSLRAIPRLRWSRIWTAVKTESPMSVEAIIEGLVKGVTVVSNGPFASISAVSNGGTECGIGGETGWRRGLVIRLEALSSPEFGEISGGMVFLGITGETEERVLGRFEKSPGIRPEENMAYSGEFPLPEPVELGAGCGPEGYVRAEVWTTFDGELRKCWTSPIYLTNATAGSEGTGGKTVQDYENL